MGVLNETITNLGSNVNGYDSNCYGESMRRLGDLVLYAILVYGIYQLDMYIRS